MDSIFHFLSVSLADKAYAVFLQCRQVFVIELIRRFVVKRRVRYILAVKPEVFLQPTLCIIHAAVGVQVTRRQPIPSTAVSTQKSDSGEPRSR